MTDLQSFDATLPPQMAAEAEAVGVLKAGLDATSLFVLAVLAGAFISLGAVFATRRSWIVRAAMTIDLTWGYWRSELVAASGPSRL